MVSVSHFEVVLCESDVCFCCVVVFTCKQFPLSRHVFFCWQLHVLLFNGSGSGGIISLYRFG